MERHEPRERTAAAEAVARELAVRPVGPLVEPTLDGVVHPRALHPPAGVDHPAVMEDRRAVEAEDSEDLGVKS